jgi:hypothetical protein
MKGQLSNARATHRLTVTRMLKSMVLRTPCLAVIGAVLVSACSSGSTTNSLSGAPGTGTSSSAPAAVKKYGCQNCHGTDMSGVTVPLTMQASGVDLYPPNLTPDVDTGIGHWTDGQLELAIKNGVDDKGEVLCPQMKHFSSITADEMAETIKFLRALPAVKKTIPGSICPPLKTAQ